jgi:dipeptidyl aminopeptidase/acylaminoacyl peptidase
MRSALAVLIGLAGAVSALARPITFDDLYGLPRCGEAQISPDGKRIVFVLTTADLKSNTRANHLWLMNADGSGQRQLTQGPSGAWSPRWSSDGQSILFLSDRGDETQVWLIPLAGGEARPATSLPTEVSEFAVSPTGHVLLLITRVFPDCETDSCNRARLREQIDDPNHPRLYNHLLFRHWNRWDDGRIKRMVLYDLASGEHRDLTTGAYDAPTALLGGNADYAISPDSREICFAMSTDSLPAVRVNNDLYIITTEGGQTAHFTTLPGLESDPQYSADGSFVAYLAAARPGYESDERDIILYDRRLKTQSSLTGDFGRSVGEYLWAPDGKSIYFLAIDHGFNTIWQVDVASRKVVQVAGDAVYDELRVSPDGRFLIVGRSVADQPKELYRLDPRSSASTRLTRFTEKLTVDLDLSRAEEFRFVGALGDSVHGFLTKPPGFDPSRRYPLVLLIHGGPQWCWLGEFNYYGWNTQFMAAQGYVVAQIDPHGSVGYGIAFQDYVSGNWGRGDVEDLMKGVDYLIAKHPFIDSTRMAALGRSYGGFMTNWICGHTDRFRCLVTIDGTFDHISDYGTTDELWFPEWEYEGTPWTNREEYVRSSPGTYAAHFRTPTLVIHGQHDYRLDLSEGLQMFTTLQRLGIPSQFLYFPDEGHSVEKLQNLRTVYEHQLAWLTRWLKQ